MLVVRIAKNHALLDGNKRLAWQSLTMFCVLNNHALEVPSDDAVELMLAIADWLVDRLRRIESP